ncbi:uncharacterized protein LOC34619629 [Cyclospora cayetanensis]|uniref:Uncharacterized protein LOC34619629 n=1 Tax=Cyclospora cayetanensis TaxID=88456 RepID=A0A6P6RS69_9EIME|nr:uncharacterized protein LOC34619629 [Cyclospora cayetanensis]
MDPVTAEGMKPEVPEVSHSGSRPSEEPVGPSESPPGGSDSTPVKAEAAQGAPPPAPADQATCDDFHLMWSELEAYLTKRFSGSPRNLVSLCRVLDHVKRQRLRVEELAFLIGNSFPDAPDVSLCMSLFLPDRTLIHAGSSAAAMCVLIQNMAPDKYAIFNSILKSCMAQKTQRGSRDILLHRMQLLFRGHPLLIRAIRKLLVQQFCIEKNGGVIRKDQAVELAKPFDDEPFQVHSVFRLAYQVGRSGGCVERARVLASSVLHLVRMLMKKRLAFSSFSSELDRAFSSFPSWFHVAGDIKRLILTVGEDDIRMAKELETAVKLIAGRNAAACQDRAVCLRYLCDLFLHGVFNQSVALRIEIDHLISRARSGAISASLAMHRIAFLVSRFPDCCEKLGILARLFRDLEKQNWQNLAGHSEPPQLVERSVNNEAGSQDGRHLASPTAPESPDVATGSEQADDHVGQSVSLPTAADSSSSATASSSGKNSSIGPIVCSAEAESLVQTTADLLLRHIAPCRFRSQDLMIQLMGCSWVQTIYSILDEWNAGRLSKDDVISSLRASVSSSPAAVESLRRLVFLLESQRCGGQGRSVLTRQQYDALPRNGSYRKLPDEWPASECSGRDALSWQVLNDRWALFPDSSESQARYMNRHEEALLSLADSRYDWDLRISRLESVLKKLEAIGEAIMKTPEEERKFCTVRPSFFRQIHIACLRRIFGSNTEQVLSSLCAAPMASLEIVYSTLECKLVQWKAMGEVLGAYWTSQEQPHYAGAIDFKKRYLGDKRGGIDVEELRAAEGRDGRTKSARFTRNEP